MDDYMEKRFGYLRILTTDEKLNTIHELEEENRYLEETIKDKRTSSEQRSELYGDIAHNNGVIEYLKMILDEKQR